MASQRDVDGLSEGWALANKITDWVGYLAGLLIVGIFTDSIVHSLAGRHTAVKVTVAVAVSISLAGVAAVLVVLVRARTIRRANTHLRAKVFELERENEALRRGERPPPAAPVPPSDRPRRLGRRPRDVR